MIEQTMVERIARSVDPEGMASDDPHRRSIGLAKARAALEAMQEPTEAMLGAVHDEPAAQNAALWQWQIMIRAALEEGS
jgi:hypothetical protein